MSSCSCRPAAVMAPDEEGAEPPAGRRPAGRGRRGRVPGRHRRLVHARPSTPSFRFSFPAGRHRRLRSAGVDVGVARRRGIEAPGGRRGAPSGGGGPGRAGCSCRPGAAHAAAAARASPGHPLQTRVASRPSGALTWVEGERAARGRTPIALNLGSSGPTRLRLAARGFQARTVVVWPGRDVVTKVVLVPEPPRDRARRPRRKARKPPPSPLARPAVADPYQKVGD